MADPVADFLAREQDELADLNDEVSDINVNTEPDTEVTDDLGFGGLSVEDTATTENTMTELEPPALALNGDVSEFLPEEDLPPTPAVRQIRPATPEKIQKWRDEQVERLQIKDGEETSSMNKLRAQATQELADWYKNRDEVLEKTKKKNADHEKDFIEERDRDIPGQEWERITRLCEFNPKAAKNAKDVSRMRSILLQLKQNPVQEVV